MTTPATRPSPSSARHGEKRLHGDVEVEPVSEVAGVITPRLQPGVGN